MRLAMGRCALRTLECADGYLPDAPVVCAANEKVVIYRLSIYTFIDEKSRIYRK